MCNRHITGWAQGYNNNVGVETPRGGGSKMEFRNQ